MDEERIEEIIACADSTKELYELVTSVEFIKWEFGQLEAEYEAWYDENCLADDIVSSLLGDRVDDL